MIRILYMVYFHFCYAFLFYLLIYSNYLDFHLLFKLKLRSIIEATTDISKLLHCLIVRQCCLGTFVISMGP